MLSNRTRECVREREHQLSIVKLTIAVGVLSHKILSGGTADNCRIDDEMWSILRDAAQQVGHTLANVRLRVVESGKQLGDDPF